MVGRWGRGRSGNFHQLVGSLVGVFGTVPFGGNPVLLIWRELHF
jgi:hypothetical protein